MFVMGGVLSWSVTENRVVECQWGSGRKSISIRRRCWKSDELTVPCDIAHDRSGELGRGRAGQYGNCEAKAVPSGEAVSSEHTPKLRVKIQSVG